MELGVMIGSLRKDSYNRKLFEYYQQLSAGVFSFYEVPTSDFQLYDSDLEGEKPQIINAHAERIRASAGVIFFSPEYNYSLPGHLKNALDWLSRVTNQPFEGKKAAIIGGSPGGIGTARMQYDLRKIGVFLNMNFLNRPEIMVSKVHEKFNEKHQLIDEQTIEIMKTHIKVFSDFLK